jgi:uroporphyrinogen decarboxylase
MSDLFLKALQCQPVKRPPVWLMRQAGRYMPEYRALREKHSLWEMFHVPEIATEVSLLPVDLLGVDAAIVFSDILVIAELLGLKVLFPEKGGPRIEPPVKTAAQVKGLPLISVEEGLGYVLETIRLVSQRISIPLIGFCGGPFTVATYLIDSHSHTEIPGTLEWMQHDPESFHALLAKVTAASIAYLKAQVKAGAQVLQIFDSWANRLSDTRFAEFSLPYLKQMVDALKEEVPVILFCRGSSLRAEELSSLHPTCISFDWHRPMHELRAIVPSHIAVQGNIDPECLKQSAGEVISSVEALVSSMQGKSGFIVNLGHGVLPDIPFEHVKAFINTVKSF